jgi:hypothetical protein
MRNAPTMTTPWMEFAADINGVWSVWGTLEITSNPTRRLSTKIETSVIRLVSIDSSSVH